MSAQDPPHASGPHGPHKEQPPPRGANPLRRTSDRAEAWCSGFLLAVLVLGLPVASVSAGLAVHESTMRTVQAQAAERFQVTARVTSAPEAASGAAADEKQKVQVRWTDKDGRQQTGSAPVPLDKTAGSTVRIWVDREGTVKNPPMPASNAKAAWLAHGRHDGGRRVQQASLLRAKVCAWRSTAEGTHSGTPNGTGWNPSGPRGSTGDRPRPRAWSRR